MANLTSVRTFVVSFFVVSLLTRMAPITPVQVTAHGRDDVEVMVVIEQVDTFGFVRSFPHDFIQMFFGHDAELVVLNHLLKSFHLVQSADVERYFGSHVKRRSPCGLVVPARSDVSPSPLRRF